MTDRFPYQRMLQESLKDELRVLNAQLPREQKSLSQLLAEEYPNVICNDGSSHLFKRKELEYLASLLTPEEQGELLLPILVEVKPGQGEMSVLCRGRVEVRVISQVIGMEIVPKQNRLTIYKPQLAVIRKQLKTTTQYLFSAKLLV